MDTSNLKVLDLEGGPIARGRMHGETLREQIHALLDRWDAALQRLYGITRARYVERFQAETQFARTLAHYAPSVLDEVRGIAEGATADFATLLAFQHVNEEFWLAAQPRDAAEACSTIAVGPTDRQPSLIGQNLDLDAYLDGFQIVLRYPADRPELRILATSVPGMISLNGMNSAGFAVCDNALTRLKSSTSGLPAFAIYRLLLESRTLEEATALIRRLPHASGLNWVMGDPERVAMFECSANAVVPYGSAEGGAICHTNHPLVNPDVAGLSSRPGRSTYLRLAAVHERLSRLREVPDVKAIAEILASRDDADYPVSRDGGRNEEDEAIGFTLACCIFALDPHAPMLHIAAGPPHRCAFKTFTP